MNDIAKKATADKFLRALEREQLTKAEAGACIGFDAPQVSYLFNEKYWERLGITYWDKLLAWVNSGQSLREYSQKHGKVLPVEKPEKIKITTAGELQEKWRKQDANIGAVEKEIVTGPEAKAFYEQIKKEEERPVKKDVKSFPSEALKASDIKSDPMLIKEAEKLKKQWNEAPCIRVPNDEVQKIRIDIEINLVINGQRIKIA